MLPRRHAPVNHAILNNIMLAVVIHNGFRYLIEASRHYMMRYSPNPARAGAPSRTAPFATA